MVSFSNFSGIFPKAWEKDIQQTAQYAQDNIPGAQIVFDILSTSLNNASALLTSSTNNNEAPVITDQRQQVLEKLTEVAEAIGYKQNSDEYSMAVTFLQNPDSNFDENSLSNLYQILSNTIDGKHQKAQLSNAVSSFLKANKITFKSYVLEKFKTVYSEIEGNKNSSGYQSLTFLLKSSGDINEDSLLKLNKALSKLKTSDETTTKQSSDLAITIYTFLTQNLNLIKKR